MVHVQGQFLTSSPTGAAESGLALPDWDWVRQSKYSQFARVCNMLTILTGDRKGPIVHVDGNCLFRKDVLDILLAVQPQPFPAKKECVYIRSTRQLGT